jgi:LysR family nitrogen assimilation transcriptional regulator
LLSRRICRAQEELRTTSEVPKGRVTLGLSPTTGPLLLPGVLERVRRQCPQVALKVVEGFSIQLYDSLLTGRVDLAVLTSPAASRALRLLPLISEPIVVLVPPQLRGSRRYYTLPEITRTPMVTTEAIRDRRRAVEPLRRAVERRGGGGRGRSDPPAAAARHRVGHHAAFDIP